jgi:hypothetical protein
MYHLHSVRTGDEAILLISLLATKAYMAVTWKRCIEEQSLNNCTECDEEAGKMEEQQPSRMILG